MKEQLKGEIDADMNHTHDACEGHFVTHQLQMW
jgi:hypothetical protein